ncbi:MAG: DUF262 domain-containing protein, partial [Cytophagales bacterium]|nr:DUF262 domain-containing protein [Cytophagales bacterium]
IKISEIVKDYKDNLEEGVLGFSGKLDIRPPYQREFVYKDKQRDAVIDTVIKGFPLNVMYWAVRDDGSYEVIDGQQRTISIAQYVDGQFSVEYNRSPLFFETLPDVKQKILDYELSIYFCTGTPSEKLDWFRTINIAGERLTPQELRNAVYAGPWVSDAKRYFSKTNCAAHNIGKDYVEARAIRQEYLEVAIKWRSKNEIEDYMGRHQHDENAKPLWEYFQKVIAWIEKTFDESIREPKFMKGVDWGPLYDDFHKEDLPVHAIKEEVEKLLLDDDVKESGIYPYVLTREEHWLNIRAFSPGQKRKAYEKQNGKCVKCDKEFKLDKMEGDHIRPWSKGGKTNDENCQVLCKPCNATKGNN